MFQTIVNSVPVWLQALSLILNAFMLALALVGNAFPASTFGAWCLHASTNIRGVIGKMSAINAAKFGAILIVAFMLGCVGGKPDPKVVQTGLDATGIAVCVLSHIDEPIEQIALECEGVTVNGVKHILQANEKAFARRAMASKACPIPGK